MKTSKNQVSEYQDVVIEKQPELQELLNEFNDRNEFLSSLVGRINNISIRLNDYNVYDRPVDEEKTEVIAKSSIIDDFKSVNIETIETQQNLNRLVKNLETIV